MKNLLTTQLNPRTHLSPGRSPKRKPQRNLEISIFSVPSYKTEVVMNTRNYLLTVVVLATGLWAQPDLFFNQGALVHVQSNALVHVQGGYVNNDQGTNQGITNNYGTIQLVNATGGWRGNLTNGTGAEFNTYPNSIVRMQGDFSNSGAYRAGTGAYGGTIEFNGVDIQNYQNTNTATEWTLHDVIVNNTATNITQRHVQIVAATAQDMHIRNTLNFQSGRIHTGSHEVRMQNTAPTAITRQLGVPVAPAAFATLVSPQNIDQYIYGSLRWNVDAGQVYPFIVGGDPGVDANPDRGIQRVDVGITAPGGGGHYVRVRFDPTVQASFTNPTYCRPGDPTPNYLYTPLNNGRWEIMPFSSITATTASAYNDLSSVTMYNRVVGNATTNGLCPPAGGGPDDYWGNSPGYPTDKCYVGYNQSGTGQLTPPNNCEGSNTGFLVTRTGFNNYNLNGTYYYATVWTQNHPLPSDELKLRAAPAGQAIRLTWDITQPEAEYILGYELYRKTELGTFTRIAQVDKQGRMQYMHDDAYVAPNTRYFYQVAQHDVFGNLRYSNIVEAILPSRGDGFSVQLQPNPIVTEGSLLATLPAEGALAFTLYDAAGKVVAQHTWTLTAGMHQLDLTPVLAQVAAGNYNAHITFGGEVKTLRLIKVDHTR